MVRKIQNRKEKNNEEENKKEMEKKAEEKDRIPPFSFKSAIVIFTIALLGSTVIPFFLTLLGMKLYLAIFLSSTFFTSFGFAWARHFIDSKEGFSKSFWRSYFILSFMIGAITYFFILKGKI